MSAKNPTKSTLKDEMEKIRHPGGSAPRSVEPTPKLPSLKPYKMPNVSDETHAPASKDYFKKLKQKLGI